MYVKISLTTVTNKFSIIEKLRIGPDMGLGFTILKLSLKMVLGYIVAPAIPKNKINALF